MGPVPAIEVDMAGICADRVRCAALSIPSTGGIPVDRYTPHDPLVRHAKVAMLAFSMAFLAVMVVALIKYM